jgi:YggT family protein
MTSSFSPGTVIESFLGIYLILLFIRVLLTWFPQVEWYNQPFSTLSQLTDPYLNLFRSFIPPVGNFDISAMVAIFALQFVQQNLPRLIQMATYSLSNNLLG